MRNRARNDHGSLGWLLALLFCLLPGHVLAQATLIAEYRFDDVAWCSPSQALDTVGGHHGSLVGAVGWEDSPASGSKPVNGAAARFAGSGAIDITGLPLVTAPGAKTSVSFWMYWDGIDNVMPVGFGWHDLWIYGGSFGFNTFNSDIYGIASAGLAGGWHHVAAVFTNGDVHDNELWIDGVKQTLTQRLSSPNNDNAVVSSHMRLSGVWGTGGYQFRGILDLVRIYNGALTQAQVDADRTSTYPAIACPSVLVTHYRLDDDWGTTHSTANEVSGGPPGVFLSPYATKVAAPAVLPNKPDTCSGARFTPGKGSMRSTGNALDTNIGGRNSVTFWMYWRGGNNEKPFGFERYDLWLVNDHFGFDTGNSDVFGIDSTGLANGWHHVAAVFTNGNVHANKLWIDGVPQTLVQKQSIPYNADAFASNTFQLSGWTYDDRYRFHGIIDEVKVYRGALTDAMVLQDMTAGCHTLFHIAIEHPTGVGLTCAASTLTIKACGDAGCSTPYTGGVSGTLSASGAVVWDGGAGFTIPAGSGSVTKSVQVPSPGSVSFGVATATPTPSNPATCNFGTPACTFTAKKAGFIFSDSSTGSPYSIPAQISGVPFGGPGSLYLRAVEAATTNPAECTPAIKNQTTAVTMGYLCNDPTTCSPGSLAQINGYVVAPSGTSITLTFNGDGSAPISARYDDVGKITLTAEKTVTPFPAATPVKLTGSSNAFVVKPDHFELSDIVCNDGTPNPASAGASGGKFCKAGENFSIKVTAKNALGGKTKNFGKETSPESVKLTSTLVPGLGLSNNPAISGSFGPFIEGEATGSFSWGEVGIITLEPGIGDDDYLGAGSVVGTTSGNVGRFYPHHFDTTVSNACGSFTYSGQPFPLKVTAKNLSGGTTANYSGAFAKNVTLSDANGAAGTFNPITLPASSFTNGEADLSVTPLVSFGYTNKLTAPGLLKVRVTDGEADSSSGSEGTTALRSGRLRLSNVFGSHSPLAMPIEAQYWSGASWVKNADDNCTQLAGIFSAPPSGWVWPASGSSTVLSGGAGTLMITGPVSGTATVTANGVSAWLKSRWNDSSAFDQPPSAQATIGIQAPETKRTVHVREVH